MNNDLYIDLETTHLLLWRARIVQIGLIWKGKEKSILINPTILIPEDSTRIHGVTNDMVKDAPKFSDIAPKLLEYIQESDSIITYNGKNFDIPILYIEFLRCGLVMPDKLILDIYEQVKLFEPNQKLSSVYLRYFNEALSDAHNALADVKATKRIREYLLKKNEESHGNKRTS
jgi:DNA polymerase-3 subunit epsilon